MPLEFRMSETRRDLPRIGVLSADHLLLDGRQVDHVWRGYSHEAALQLAYTARQFGLQQVWLTAECRGEQRAWNEVALDNYRVHVVAPDHDKSSPFRDLAPHQLLGEVLEFMDATGTLWRMSGAVTSDAWLRDHYGSKLRQTEYPEIARDGNLEPDLRWKRDVSAREKRARFCYAFDANAMYLGAASSLALPVGKMVHSIPPLANAEGPAYWHAYPDEYWAATPTFSMTFEYADDGYWWPEHHRFLEPWYKMLRDARAKLLPYGDSPALQAVKQVYRMGIGRLGSERRSMPNDPLYQPYWRHAVQAQARCNLLRRVDRLAQGPVAIDVDCLYFLTSSPDPAKFAAKIGLPLGERIGEYKLAGTVAGRVARDLLGSDRIGEVLGGLREAA